MKIESFKYFMEFGVTPILSSRFSSGARPGKLQYSGINIEVGSSFYLSQGNFFSPYVGFGINPRMLIDMGGGSVGGLALLPYAQFGMMFLRDQSMRFFIDFRIAQNIIAIVDRGNGVYDPELGKDVYEYSYDYYPTEFGLQMGFGW